MAYSREKTTNTINFVGRTTQLRAPRAAGIWTKPLVYKVCATFTLLSLGTLSAELWAQRPKITGPEARTHSLK